MNPNILFLEGLFVAVFVLIGNFFCKTEGSIIHAPIGNILVVVGVTWIIYSIFTAFLKSFKHTISAISTAILLLIYGVMISPDARPIPSDSVIGNCKDAEWSIVINYDESGYRKSKSYSFKGDTEDSDKAIMEIATKWMLENCKNDRIEYISTEKILCWIPENYAVKNNYPMELTKRF